MPCSISWIHSCLSFSLTRTPPLKINGKIIYIYNLFFFFKFDRFFFNSCGRVDRHWWQRGDWGLWLVHHYRGRLGGPPDPYTLNTDAHLVQETQVWRIGKISLTIYFDEGAFQNLFENKNYVFLSFFNRTMPLQNRFFRTMLLTNPVEKARLSWFVFFALFLIEELPLYIHWSLVGWFFQ